jgi:hypothetical protein
MKARRDIVKSDVLKDVQVGSVNKASVLPALVEAVQTCLPLYLYNVSSPEISDEMAEA